MLNFSQNPLVIVSAGYKVARSLSRMIAAAFKSVTTHGASFLGVSNTATGHLPASSAKYGF